MGLTQNNSVVPVKVSVGGPRTPYFFLVRRALGFAVLRLPALRLEAARVLARRFVVAGMMPSSLLRDAAENRLWPI